MRSPLRRLERAYQAFFRRVKAGEKPGYPRFRSRRRYDSLTWDSAWCIQERRLALQGIGHLKVKWHRELPPSAKVCTVTVRRVVGRWYACFALALQVSAPLARTTMRAVGVDLGIQTFAALSTGELFGARVPTGRRSASCAWLSDGSRGASMGRAAGKKLVCCWPDCTSGSETFAGITFTS